LAIEIGTNMLGYTQIVIFKKRCYVVKFAYSEKAYYLVESAVFEYNCVFANNKVFRRRKLAFMTLPASKTSQVVYRLRVESRQPQNSQYIYLLQIIEENRRWLPLVVFCNVGKLRLIQTQ